MEYSLKNLVVIVSVAVLSVLLTPHSIAQEQSIESSIVSVVVYPDGATITRTASVSLAAGTNDLVFTGLVSNLSADRFRLQIDDEGVELGQVNFNRVQSDEAFNTAVQELQDKILAVDLQISATNDATKTAQLQLKFLDGIAQGYAKESWFEGARGNADISSWQAALAVLQQGSDKAQKEIRDNGVELRELAKRKSQLERELSTLRGGQLASTQVSVAATTATTKRVQVSFDYFQYNARWSPTFEARLDSDDGALQLIQQAQVSQNTAESWDGVELSLSTNAPSGDLIAPQIKSEFLNLIDGAPRTLMSKSRVMAAEPAASDAIEEVVVTGAYAAPPQVNNFSVTYDVPGTVSVANDTSESQTFELSRKRLDANLVTQVVPRFSTDAFVVARMVYQSDEPLMAGPMRAYVDGVYVGLTRMPSVLPGAELELPMGQDRRIEVRAVNQGGKVGKSGLIGRRKIERTDYLFALVNRRPSETLIEVYDRYPVARNNEISVDVPRTATKPDETDIEDQPGLILWRKNVDAGETWQLVHQYEVSYPAKKFLVTQ